MNFKVQKAVLDSGVKIVFVVVEGREPDQASSQKPRNVFHQSGSGYLQSNLSGK